MLKDNSSKAKLIRSMAQLILEKGLANTSPQDVLDHAQLGKGSFYHHFSGKYDLARHAVKYNIDCLISETDSALQKEDSTNAKLIAFFNKQRDIERGCLAGQMARDKKIMSEPELAREVQKGFEWTRSLLEDLIRKGIDDGSVSSALAPLEATTLIISVLQGSYVAAKGLQDSTYFNISMQAIRKIIIL